MGHLKKKTTLMLYKLSSCLEKKELFFSSSTVKKTRMTSIRSEVSIAYYINSENLGRIRLNLCYVAVVNKLVVIRYT